MQAINYTRPPNRLCFAELSSQVYDNRTLYLLWLRKALQRQIRCLQTIYKLLFTFSQMIPKCHTVCSGAFGFASPTISEAFEAAAILSSSSSGVPSLQAHESTNLKVSLCHILFINSSLIGTSAMMMTGNAGAPFVSVTMKMTTVTTICTMVYTCVPQ